MVLSHGTYSPRGNDGMSAFSILSSGVVDAIMCDVAVVASDAPSTQEFCKCKALWDTGAVFSVISRRLASQLGLMPIDKGFAYTVQGTYEPSVYLLDVMLPNGMVVKNLHVSDGDFDDCDVLIGMDIIKLGDLQITNYGQTKFIFRIPADPSPIQ